MLAGVIGTPEAPADPAAAAKEEKKEKKKKEQRAAVVVVQSDDTADAPVVVRGQVLNRQISTDGKSALVVVKVLEEEETSLSRGGIPTSGVSLATALGPRTPVAKVKMIDGVGEDPTGRTVTFHDGTMGTVVAHRDPISFVLASCSSNRDDGDEDEEDEMCNISSRRTTIDPSMVPPGSIVDYLGCPLDVSIDGYIVTRISVDDTAKDLSIDSNNNEGRRKRLRRPLFVPTPKISDIGLIDSPLVTGITAIDALTPIGKGQNMLIIGTEEMDECGGGGGENGNVRLNKRGWMINLLRNVVENHRRSGGNMLCFFCLTSTDPKVRTFVLQGISDAGIRDDIVTVLASTTSTSFGTNSKHDNRIGAAEAVAAAATACTLAEHHALTMGGDAVVVIDDVNLHKSLWDITTHELVGVFGTKSVVEADLNGGSSSEMRGYFSGLIQRAARFSIKKGGGSVTLILLSTLPDPDGGIDNDEEWTTTTFTASDFDSMSEKIRARIRMLVSANVPLTATNLRKIKLPVPRQSAAEDQRRLAMQHIEDLISMSDGQVWLDGSMKGRSPPLDPSRSITRVGVGADTLSRADAPALRSVVGSLRFEFQQALDLSPDSSSSSPGSMGGGGDDNSRQVRRRDAFLLAMYQEVHEGRKLSDECTLLLAASRGHLDSVLAEGGMAGTLMGQETIKRMLEYVRIEAGEITHSIDETLDLSSEGRSALEDAIIAYFTKR